MARYEDNQPAQNTASAPAAPAGPDITKTPAYQEMLSKGNLTTGQRQAYMALATMQTRGPSDYIASTNQGNIYADPDLQGYLTSSEGSYDPAYIQSLVAQRTAALNDKQKLGQDTYNSYVKQASDSVDWWNAHPNGNNDIMDVLMPLAIGAIGVIALAGAGAAALGAAESAGSAAAGATTGAEIGSAVGSSIGAVATDSTVAGALAGSAVIDPAIANTVIVTGTAGGAAAGGVTLGQLAAGAAGLGAVGAVAGAGGSAAPAAPATQAGQPNHPGVDPNVPNTVNVSAPHVPPAALPGDLSGAGAAAAAATAAAAGGAAAANTVEVHGQKPTDSVPVLGPGDIAPIPIPPMPGLPDVQGAPPGTTGSHPPIPNLGGSGTPGVNLGGLLPGVAVGGLLGGLTSGLTSPTTSGNVTNDVSKLNSQGDAQMADWLNYLYPHAKDALDSNKAATDAFVNASNVNAGKLEGMGDQQRGAATDWLNMYHNTYVPQAQRIIDDANQFDKAGYAEQQAGLSIGDLSSAFAADKAARAQQLAAYGVDPSSGRALALDRAAGVQNTANIAAAANKARMAAEDIWGKKQMDALGTATTLGGALNTYGNLNQGAGSLFTNANSVRQQGVKATDDYFTNVNDLAKTSDQTYGTVNTAYTNAGQLGLGQSKLDYDKYIAEMQGRGQVIGAGLSALAGNNGISTAVGNVAKGIGDGLGSLGSWFSNGITSDGTSLAQGIPVDQLGTLGPQF